MKLVFFVKSKAISDAIDVEMEHKGTLEKCKEGKIKTIRQGAKSIAMEHGKEVNKKKPKKGMKKYYNALDKMEKKVMKKSFNSDIEKFLKNKGNRKIKDSEIHAFAKRLGMSPDKMEEKIYKMLQQKLKKSTSNLSSKQKNALKHKNKLGAGAKKRKKLQGKEKIPVVMKEFKRGTLHSGSGKKVTNRKQAVAIAMSEAGLSKK